MKKILIAVMALTISVMAGNSITTKVKNEKGINFILDKEMIMMYDNDETTTAFTDIQGKALKNILKKSVCSDKDTNKLVSKLKYSMKFIYIHKKAVTVVVINDCKGVEITK